MGILVFIPLYLNKIIMQSHLVWKVWILDLVRILNTLRLDVSAAQFGDLSQQFSSNVQKAMKDWIVTTGQRRDENIVGVDRYDVLELGTCSNAS